MDTISSSFAGISPAHELLGFCEALGLARLAVVEPVPTTKLGHVKGINRASLVDHEIHCWLK